MRRPRGALLFMLVALLAALPVLGNTTLELVVFDLLFSATVALGLWAAADRPRQLYIGIALGVLALPAQWISYFTESTPLLMLRIGLTISFLGFTALVAAHALVREREVGFDTIAGGISIYLLMVVIWALAYGAVEILAPGSFLVLGEIVPPDARGGLNGDGVFETLIYFSFVTITTLGYGDITPIGDVARMLCVFEAFIGQLFLVVFIARLVSLHASSQK